MPLTTEQLIAKVLALAPATSSFWVAYSGGLDSQVLLHALAAGREQLPAPLSALHVNHNLQPDAPAWAEQCRAVCAELGIAYRSLSVQAHAQPGESPEAAARAARYQALVEAVPKGGVLLTAHHQDDQAETLLLQLVRGAGPKGLAAMPERALLGDVPLLRPLLDVSRAALLAYAEQHCLRWLEDPTNASTEYDRNFLRHEILPRVRRRWPAAGATLARAARHQAEAAGLLGDLAAVDAQCAAGNAPMSLSVAALLRLTAPRRANLLRHWLRQRRASVPSTAVLARIEADVLLAAVDAQPLVRWGGVNLRRYRDALYLDDVLEESDPSRCLDWSLDQSLPLVGGTLSVDRTHGEGVAMRFLADSRIQVRFRQGGEMLRPAGRREHHSLKHLFQEAGVPPWERARVPLIYRDDALIAVAGYWVCAEFQAAADEPGMRFFWSRAIVPTGSFW